MRTLSLLIFAVALLNHRRADAAPVRRMDAPALAEEPFELVGRVPVVRGSVNGSEPLNLILDTGATETVLTPAAARRLGIPTRYFSENQRKASLRSLSVGSAALNDISVFVFDPPQALPLRLDRGLDYHGILGQPFLSRFITTLDYGRGRVAFRALPAAAAGALPARMPVPAGAVRVGFDIQEGLIHVQGRINGKGPMTFIVDTGSAETLLLPSSARSFGVFAVNNDFAPAFVLFDAVTAGEAVARQIPGVIHAPPHERGYRMTYDGILGTTFLSRFVVTVNYAEHALFFQPATQRPGGQ